MIKQDNVERSKAIEISGVCIFTYLIGYYIRHILGVLTPSMLSGGAFQKEYLALLASTYMMVYAVGQLLNGVIGDYIKPKFIVLTGLVITSLGLFLFSAVSYNIIGIICFGLIGFGLSTLRGPLVKVISENTLPKYARVSCTFLSFASFAGPLLAGLAAMIMKWRTVFAFSGIATLAMAVFTFVMLSFFENKNMIVSYSEKQATREQKISIFGVFRLENFIVYMFVGMIVEIATTSINFWMPTYFNEHLRISELGSNMVFSAISFIRALCPFATLYIFKKFKENDILIVKTAFTLSMIFFIIMAFVNTTIINIVLLLLALMSSSVASSTMWSIYIPSLAKSGRVSTANGVLDCIGYIAASIANIVFVPISNHFGWTGVIISWAAIMLAGIVVTYFAKQRK